MTPTDQYTNERPDHLGIVAGACQEIGLAAWLDAQDQGNRKPGKRWHNNRHDPQWARWKPPPTVFGAAVLRQWDQDPADPRRYHFILGERPVLGGWRGSRA